LGLVGASVPGVAVAAKRRLRLPPDKDARRVEEEEIERLGEEIAVLLEQREFERLPARRQEVRREIRFTIRRAACPVFPSLGGKAERRP